MPQRVGLTNRIYPPKQDHVCVFAQIFLGRCLDRPRQSDPKATKPPAHHRWIPLLAPIKVGEPVHLRPFQTEGIVIDQIAVPLPKADPLAPHAAHML